jgi:ZIP family zinc transporter
VIEAFLWGLLAASSLLLGAFVVTVHDPHKRALGVVMAFGAGVLLGSVFFELIDEAVDIAGGLGSTTVGFFVGAGVFTAGDYLISKSGYGNRKDIDGAPPDAGGLTIALGALLDGVPETAVLGLTLLLTGEIGVSLLVAVFVSNVPEAIAASSSLKAGGWSPAKVYGLWTMIALVSALAAALGYAFLDGASPDALAFVYAFAAGAILTMLATSMMPEAFEEVGRAAGVATVFGATVALGLDWMQG